MRKKQHEGQGAFDWEPAEETIPEPEAHPPQATGQRESIPEGGELYAGKPVDQVVTTSDNSEEATQSRAGAAYTPVTAWALGTKSGWQLCGKCTLCLEVKRSGKWELR